MKILVARCDRLGDLVLSLPVVARLREARPDWELHALVAAGAEPLVENDPALDAIYSWSGVADPVLERKLAAERYDAAVILQFQTPLAAMLRRCGVRRRIGPLSKWASWLLLNRGRWQSRSRVRKHERDYNLDLLRALIGGAAAGAAPAPDPVIHLRAEQVEQGRRFREREAAGARTVVYVHPGSGGSALDWEPKRFADVANALARIPGCRVFVTGSHHDRLSLDGIAPFLESTVAMVAERFALRELLGVLAAGDAILAPSTGPLHVGAALGLAAVGLYPPAPTMSPRRWGPLGPWSVALMPTVTCPAKKNCLLGDCLLHNCLDALMPATVVETVQAMVARREAARAAPNEENPT